MNINLQDENVRENYMRHLKDNKQFNVYPDYTFAEKLINEMEVKQCYKKPLMVGGYKAHEFTLWDNNACVLDYNGLTMSENKLWWLVK